MSPIAIGALGLLVLMILLFARMWIGAAMAFVGIVGIAYFRGWANAFTSAGLIPFENIAFYTISAIPFFVLMGMLIGDAGMGKDLYNAANKWVGHVRGGLAMATIIACAAIAAITGTSGTGTIIMGKLALPEMTSRNYDLKMSTASIASAGTLGILIPPSLGFILYGLMTQESIGKLFMAGVLPGILLTFLLCSTVGIQTLIRPAMGPAGPKSTNKERLKSLGGVWHTLVLFVIVLGGIYAGVITPTEAGAVGAFGALVIAVATRRINFKKFTEATKETVTTTSMVLFIICGAFILAKFLALSQLPQAMATFIGGLDVPRVVIFIGIVILYLILGMFLEIFSSVVLTIPVIYPLILTLGYDPIWFGVVVVILIEAGLVTPPVGMNVFVLSAVSGVPTRTIFAGVWPFVAAMIICIAIITAFPQIALFLPNSMK
jgi:C4-dicarboxylate transporter DctM subunit